MHMLYNCETKGNLRARRMAPHRQRLLVWLAATLILISLPASELSGQEQKPTQYEVQAAYLYNFGKFVNWPPSDASSHGPFVICVLGEDPFGAILDKTTAGETINGKQIVDKRIARAEEATSCSILYVSPSEAERLSRVLAAVKDAPVLTVSDMPGFVEHGGMIEFVLENGRVRFEVNLNPTTRDGLTFSSELLKVAVKIAGSGKQESR